MNTHKHSLTAILGLLLLAAAFVVGCGAPTPATTTVVRSGGPSATTVTSSPSVVTQAATSTSTSQAAGQAAGALTAEADSAATGDVPDNQVFLTFHDSAVPLSVQYPEGWAQSGAGRDITFKDKNNIVHIVVLQGTLPTLGTVRAQMAELARSTASLRLGQLQSIKVHGAPAVKVTYTTESAPSPVTGKTVTLAVDRYYLAHAGRVAVVDLGTPQGVDNVDAFRQMVESFQWR